MACALRVSRAGRGLRFRRVDLLVSLAARGIRRSGRFRCMPCVRVARFAIRLGVHHRLRRRAFRRAVAEGGLGRCACPRLWPAFRARALRRERSARDARQRRHALGVVYEFRRVAQSSRDLPARRVRPLAASRRDVGMRGLARAHEGRRHLTSPQALGQGEGNVRPPRRRFSPRSVRTSRVAWESGFRETASPQT